MKTRDLKSIDSKPQRGAVLALTAFLLIALIGVAAFAIDIGHLYVVKNELQNAADAGALAGGQFLYKDPGWDEGEYGTMVNPKANEYAYETAKKNASDKIAVDIKGGYGNLATDDVQRGHWSFANRKFTRLESEAPIDLWGVATEDLDKMDGTYEYPPGSGLYPEFINAVKVTARRDDTPALSFFARIFGFEDFIMAADAVAYIGFAGTLGPNEADQPIAICEESVEDENGLYTCNVGMMLNSGADPSDHNTAGWTDFSQPCSGAASTSEMTDLLSDCTTGNPDIIELGGSIGTTGGVVDGLISQPAQPDIMDCWRSALYDSNGDDIPDASVDTDGDGWPDKFWNMTLPVISCPGNNVGNCSEVKGAVNVNVVWILEKENKIDDDAPYLMEDWANTSADGATRWNSFVSHFQLQTIDENGNYVLATVENNGFKKKGIYFLPDCSPHAPAGQTGGENYGVLADDPVLVE